ncbi:hypothetical protein EVAR_94424_1 [Eumeta japonica]|uniref:Uncharacterized protein n=1 Tax=Eumeta variegata TaxID=151549 RepID=A0A4C1TQ58_EUMVA|nr:hypothetical protein EVAR_94424_1 [Eumeta japonica]
MRQRHIRVTAVARLPRKLKIKHLTDHQQTNARTEHAARAVARALTCAAYNWTAARCGECSRVLHLSRCAEPAFYFWSAGAGTRATRRLFIVSFAVTSSDRRPESCERRRDVDCIGASMECPIKILRTYISCDM